MEQTTATQPETTAPETPAADSSCPHCGETAQKDQLVCLRCGGRIALDYRRPPGWKLPTAIVAGMALVAAVAFGWGLREITDDAESEVAATPAGKPAAAAPGPTDAERRKAAADRRRADADAERASRSDRTQAAADRRRAAARKRQAAAAPAGANLAGTWPTGKDGFTVIIASVDNPASAKTTTRTVRQAGVPAGYLRSNDYPSLQKGFWYVYGGVYSTRGSAEKAAAKFGRGYPGAYVQFVSGAKAAERKTR